MTTFNFILGEADATTEWERRVSGEAEAGSENALFDARILAEHNLRMEENAAHDAEMEAAESRIAELELIAREYNDENTRLELEILNLRGVEAELEAKLNQAQANATFAEEQSKKEKHELEAQLSDAHGYAASLEAQLAESEHEREIERSFKEQFAGLAEKLQQTLDAVVEQKLAAEARADAAEAELRDWIENRGPKLAIEVVDEQLAEANSARKTLSLVLEQAIAQRDEADTRAEKAEAALEKLEWSKREAFGDFMTCPVCLQRQHNGHKADCFIAAALHPATNAEQPAPRDVSGESEGRK